MYPVCMFARRISLSNNAIIWFVQTRAYSHDKALLEKVAKKNYLH